MADGKKTLKRNKFEEVFLDEDDSYSEDGEFDEGNVIRFC